MSGFGDSLTTVGTVQLHPLGTIVVEPATQSGTRANQGEKHWIYVGNNSGAPIALGHACTRTLGGPSPTNEMYRITVAATSAPVSNVIGVAQAIIPDGSYAFIARKGIATALADATGATTALPLVVDASTAGCVSHGGATDPGFGQTLAGRAGAGTFTVYLDCKG